eukprot:93115-Pyramimonas_sp.AAC.1
MATLVCDEAHIRSQSYSHLFRLMMPLVHLGKLEVVIVSATLSLDALQSFCAGVDMAVVDIQARQYPLHRFEPEEDVAFADDADLQEAL